MSMPGQLQAPVRIAFAPRCRPERLSRPPMAKTKEKEAPPPPSPKVSLPPSPQVMAAYRAVKVVAMLFGFAATLIGLMASIGALTQNGYARLLGALFVTLAVPLAIG